MLNRNLIIYGTRPDEIKLKSLVDVLGDDCVTLCTRQSRDLLQMIIKPNMVESIEYINDAIRHFKPKRVIVQGDTRTAFYGALKAFEANIPVAHVEAGLRTWDLQRPFPEEGYRRMISEIASLHFCPTAGAVNNLKAEGITDNVYMVGQTSLDYIKTLVKPVEEKNFILVTIHRNEADIDKIISELKKIDYKMIITAHPNKHGRKLRENFKCINPVPVDKFIELLLSCWAVITDSGGVQEEAVFLNKPLIIARKITERPEALKTGGTLIGENISENITKALSGTYTHKTNPFGDGHSAERIKNILNDYDK